MIASRFLNKFRMGKLFNKKTALACFFTCTLACYTSPIMAQVGPMAPPEKPAAVPPSVETVKNAFKKLFQKEEPAQETAKESATPGNADQANGTSMPPQEAEAPKRPSLMEQPPLGRPDIAQPEVSQEDPPIHFPEIDNPTNPLGFMNAQNKLNSLETQIDKGDLFKAKPELATLRKWLIDATEAHIDLYKTLEKIPSARTQAELEKQLALKFALLRDRALFLNGKIFVVEKNNKAAVKELTEVIKSQPRSDMGLKAYEMLQGMGFTQKLQIAE